MLLSRHPAIPRNVTRIKVIGDLAYVSVNNREPAVPTPMAIPLEDECPDSAVNVAIGISGRRWNINAVAGRMPIYHVLSNSDPSVIEPVPNDFAVGCAEQLTRRRVIPGEVGINGSSHQLTGFKNFWDRLPYRIAHDIAPLALS